jgi:hemoglobin
MKPDISPIEDIYFLLKKNYNNLLMHEKKVPFFAKIVKQNHLKSNIKVIANFWNDILFDTLLYR